MHHNKLNHIGKERYNEMKKRIFSGKLIALFLLMLMIVTGCDMLTTTTETPPDKLPPVPEKCMTLYNTHKNALLVAYSSAEASQMQVARVANEFTQCIENEGLSRADAKGMLKKNEADAKLEVEKIGDPGAGGFH
jgi:hypothetical protein